MNHHPQRTAVASAAVRAALANGRYRASRRSTGYGQCVLVAREGDLVGIQDSKLPGGERQMRTLVVSWPAFCTFVAGVKCGRHDAY